MFCPNCGKQLETAINFCPYCGFSLTEGSTAVSLSNVNSAAVREYQLVLVSGGSAGESVLRGLLSDVFNYSYAETTQLLNNVPVQIAQNLLKMKLQFLEVCNKLLLAKTICLSHFFWICNLKNKKC